jgi:hypothetical protein
MKYKLMIWPEKSKHASKYYLPNGSSQSTFVQNNFLHRYKAVLKSSGLIFQESVGSNISFTIRLP